mmetsp:Transcript_80018/g.141202  ORF Transcript_80018/g.141202 Transcript_80018/m.141202 type:complete len:119 (-) Transcript_80018:510-866(-)
MPAMDTANCVNAQVYSLMTQRNKKVFEFKTYKQVVKSACAKDRSAHLIHHGGVLVRKSVSGHVDMEILPSSGLTEVCDKAKESGAGPRTTLPFSSYWEPWQGQQNLLADRTHGTTQPR